MTTFHLSIIHSRVLGFEYRRCGVECSGELILGLGSGRMEDLASSSKKEEEEKLKRENRVPKNR